MINTVLNCFYGNVFHSFVSLALQGGIAPPPDSLHIGQNLHLFEPPHPPSSSIYITKLWNLDRNRSMMTSRAVLLFIFVDCKTILLIQNQHGVTLSSSRFGLNSTACILPTSVLVAVNVFHIIRCAEKERSLLLLLPLLYL